MNKAMKKLIYILSAGLLVMAVSCRQQETPYVPGEPEVDGCYGVYFPDQEAATTHYFDPSENKTVDITVKRTNAEGAIDVPFVLVGENTDVYTPGTIHFDNAQEETTLTLSLNSNAKEIELYPVTVEIQDPQYAAKYSKNNAFFSMSSMIVVWKNMGTFEIVEDTYWGEGFTTDIIYYEVDGVRYCKTQNYRDRHALGEGSISEKGGFWGTSPDLDLQFEWYPEIQDPNDYDYVCLPPNDMGYPHASYGTRYYCDYFSRYRFWGTGFTSYESFGDYLKDNNPPAFNYCYYDPKGELVFNYSLIVEAGSFGDNVLRAWKQGYVPVDYSLSISADVSEDGVSPLYIQTGADVASVAYVIYEGALGKAVIGDHVSAIAKGEEEVETFTISDPSATSTIEVSLDKTGEYTIIAIPVNDGGEMQPDNYAYTVFCFLAPGDENPVVANAGLETLSGKYVPQGYNQDTALEFWAYGTDITVAKAGIFTYAEYVSATEEELKEFVKSGEDLGEEALEAINGEGYSLIVENLLPGTQYVALVYFSNGYEELWIEDAATTTGKPLPIYQSFTYQSYVDELEPSSQNDLFGVYNYYGIEYNHNKTGLRDYLGKVEIKDSKAADKGPDENGLNDEYVTITGLGGSIMKKLGVNDDSMEADLYGGLLYFPIDNKDASGNTVYTMSGDGGGYNATNVSYFIPVMDGYWALVSSSRYAASYNFTGIGWYLGGDSLASWFYDLLLVDPKKDDNGIAPSRAVIDYAISKKIAQIERTKIQGSKEARPVSEKVLQGVKMNSTRIPFAGKKTEAKVKLSSSIRVVAPGRYHEADLIVK
jgi:hypothetical protein